MLRWNSPNISPLRLCTPREVIDPEDGMCKTVLQFSGRGSTTTNASYSFIPRRLRESMAKKSAFKNDQKEPCPDKEVCVTPFIHGTNICRMDDGGPLFKPECKDLKISQCLYGVTSYYANKIDSPDHVCNDGSFFVHVPQYYEWVHQIIARYPD